MNYRRIRMVVVRRRVAALSMLFLLTIVLLLAYAHDPQANFIAESSVDEPLNFSIIVPTFKEQGNLAALTARLFGALGSAKLAIGGASVELVFVDDNSADGTTETVHALQQRFNVRLVERDAPRGLSSAVLDGMRAASGHAFVVMDADLQHPPEVVPQLLQAIRRPGIEMVIGSRYTPGAVTDAHWPLHRRIISFGARLLAWPLTPMTDPMSGFFAIRRSVVWRGLRNVDADSGYKIALELFVKCGVANFEEVPFTFGSRSTGHSKLSGSVMFRYVLQLVALYSFRCYTCVLLMVVCASATACALLVWWWRHRKMPAGFIYREEKFA